MGIKFHDTEYLCKTVENYVSLRDITKLVTKEEKSLIWETHINELSN